MLLRANTNTLPATAVTPHPGVLRSDDLDRDVFVRARYKGAHTQIGYPSHGRGEDICENAMAAHARLYVVAGSTTHECVADVNILTCLPETGAETKRTTPREGGGPFCMKLP